MLTSVCPPRTRTATQYYIALFCSYAATPLHYILSICTRYRRYALLPLHGNSAPRLSLCASRCAPRAGAAHPVLSTLHHFCSYIPLIYHVLFCGLSDTLLL